MAAAKNAKRGFGATLGQKVLDAVNEGNTEKVARNELATRGSALSKSPHDVVYTQNQWMDPALCRPSPVNARDYDALTYDDCADLIETIKSEGAQRTAATVRPTGDDAQPYEIVAGLRRHWSISWLRDNNYPDFKYLINVQKMDDEAAFRFSDLENRARTDITDLERARSYQKALDQYYAGEQLRMAERIGISTRSLKRHLQLARLDSVFIEALGGHRQVKLKHAEDIASAAKTSSRLDAMKAEAENIIAESAAGGGQGALTSAKVVNRIIKAASHTRASGSGKRTVEIRDASGQPMIAYVPGTVRNALTIKIDPKTAATPAEIKAALSKIVDEMQESRS